MLATRDEGSLHNGDFNASDVARPNVSTTNNSHHDLPEDILVTKNQFPTHEFLWRIGIIFAISGIIILASFLAMYGFSYTRRRRLFRRRRRRSTNLAFENQLSMTHDEADHRHMDIRAEDAETVPPVHSSCNTHSRWTRDDNMPRPRSRSNSRSRSLSPGHARSRTTSPPGAPRTVEDDMLMHGDAGLSEIEKLDNARLAFKDDASKYAEYNSTKDREDMRI